MANSVWGKNPQLENFWQSLALGEIIVVIYQNGKHDIVELEKEPMQQYMDLDNNAKVKAILSSGMSTDSYLLLYSKGWEKSVEEVILDYKRYWKTGGKTPTYLYAQGWRWDKVLDIY